MSSPRAPLSPERCSSDSWVREKESPSRRWTLDALSTESDHTRSLDALSTGSASSDQLSIGDPSVVAPRRIRTRDMLDLLPGAAADVGGPPHVPRTRIRLSTSSADEGSRMCDDDEEDAGDGSWASPVGAVASSSGVISGRCCGAAGLSALATAACPLPSSAPAEAPAPPPPPPPMFSPSATHVRGRKAGVAGSSPAPRHRASTSSSSGGRGGSSGRDEEEEGKWIAAAATSSGSALGSVCLNAAAGPMFADGFNLRVQVPLLVSPPSSIGSGASYSGGVWQASSSSSGGGGGLGPTAGRAGSAASGASDEELAQIAAAAPTAAPVTATTRTAGMCVSNTSRVCFCASPQVWLYTPRTVVSDAGTEAGDDEDDEEEDEEAQQSARMEPFQFPMPIRSGRGSGDDASYCSNGSGSGGDGTSLATPLLNALALNGPEEATAGAGPQALSVSTTTGFFRPVDFSSSSSSSSGSGAALPAALAAAAITSSSGPPHFGLGLGLRIKATVRNTTSLEMDTRDNPFCVSPEKAGKVIRKPPTHSTGHKTATASSSSSSGVRRPGSGGWAAASAGTESHAGRASATPAERT